MWKNIITTTTSAISNAYINVNTFWSTGIVYNTGPQVSPWEFNGNAVYAESFNGTNYIKVDKGSSDKARYVIFYAINYKDPMIFCKTRRDLYKEVKKLLKREEVDIKSIRIFSLVGGAKKILRQASKK